MYIRVCVRVCVCGDATEWTSLFFLFFFSLSLQTDRDLIHIPGMYLGGGGGGGGGISRDFHPGLILAIALRN